MGLDIYLYTREQAEQNEAYNKASAEWFGEGLSDGEQSPYDLATPDERDEWHRTHDYATHSGVPSVAHPDHLFNRRYLRSSYNDAGFNRTVPQMLGREADLAWIFEPVRLEDQYGMELTAASIPGLRESRARALGVVEELLSCDQLKVFTEAHNPFAGPTKLDDAEALAWYRERREQDSQRQADDDWSWYSTRGGSVFGVKGVTVLAVVAGVDALGSPGVHLIYRADDETRDSYAQSAEIVAEFCDEAISLIERDGSCQMSWSG